MENYAALLLVPRPRLQNLVHAKAYFLTSLLWLKQNLVVKASEEP